MSTNILAEVEICEDRVTVERRCDGCKLVGPKGCLGLDGFGGDSRVKSGGNSLRLLENRTRQMTGGREA